MRSYHDGPVSYLYVDRTWDVVSRREADSIWDAARRRLMDDVYGVEVARVAASRKVFDASLQMGASAMGSGPQVVEEVRAVVSHICMMVGEYRTFAGSLLHRRWELQRMDNGPWRITSPHGI